MKRSSAALAVGATFLASCYHTILDNQDMESGLRTDDRSVESYYKDDQLVAINHSQAIAYCAYLSRVARHNANASERWGFALTPIGVLATGVGTAAVAKVDGTGETIAAAGVAAFGAVLTGLGIYMFTNAANERNGFGLLSAGVIQMRHVDEYSTQGSNFGTPLADVPREVTRWQTCTKILAGWQASAGAGDAALAGAFGGKAGGDGDSGKKKDSADAGSAGSDAK